MHSCICLKLTLVIKEGMFRYKCCVDTYRYLFKNADVCLPETPTPLESANVCNWVPPPPKNCGHPLWTAPRGLSKGTVLCRGY